MTDTQKGTLSVSRELLALAVTLPSKESREANWHGMIERGLAQAELRAILAQPAEQQDEPVYQVSDGVHGWQDVDRLRYTACQLEPEEYECRALYRRPAAQAVKLPERRNERPLGNWTTAETYREAKGFNDALDAVAKLNGIEP